MKVERVNPQLSQGSASQITIRYSIQFSNFATCVVLMISKRMKMHVLNRFGLTWVGTKIRLAFISAFPKSLTECEGAREGLCECENTMLSMMRFM